MANLSFDITNSQGFYDKLKDDYNDFLRDSTSSRLAVNCAITAWHLVEWLYDEFKTQLSCTYSNITAYQIHLETVECKALETMHRITNGSKHSLSSKQSQKVQFTKKHLGPFSNVFARQFDQTCLLVTLNDGTEVYFEDELKLVMKFWKSYIHSTFGLIA